MWLVVELVETVFWAIALSLAAVFVTARMLCVGLSVRPGDVSAVLGDGTLLVRAAVANLVAVPLLGLALVTLMPLSMEARVALLLVAFVPGGLDFLALALAPSRQSRVGAALVLLLSLAATGIVPALWWLTTGLGATPLASPLLLAALTIGGLLLPMLAGVLVRRSAPAVTDRLAAAMAVLSLALFAVAAVATIVLRPGGFRAVGVTGVAAMLLLVAGSALVGLALGGPSSEGRARLASVTATRNAGLSFLVALSSFPQTGVDLAVLLFAGVLVALRLLGVAAASLTAPYLSIAGRTRRPP